LAKCKLNQTRHKNKDVHFITQLVSLSPSSNMTSNLNDFLDYIRANLADNTKSKVIVTGNDSAGK
jgi:hypothetical protein